MLLHSCVSNFLWDDNLRMAVSFPRVKYIPVYFLTLFYLFARIPWVTSRTRVVNGENKVWACNTDEPIYARCDLDINTNFQVPTTLFAFYIFSLTRFHFFLNFSVHLLWLTVLSLFLFTEF